MTGMSAPWVPLLALFLAGCTGGGDTPEDRCRRQVYDDPAVKDQVMLSNSDAQQVRGPALIVLDAMVRQKTRNCLAASGVGAPGGVEAVKPY